MTAYDDKFRALAAKLVAKFGVAATLRSRSGEYEPDRGEVFGETTTDVPVVATPPLDFATVFRDGAATAASSFGVILAARDLAAAPAVGNHFVHAAKAYVVHRVVPIWSGAAVAAYALEVADR